MRAGCRRIGRLWASRGPHAVALRALPAPARATPRPSDGFLPLYDREATQPWTAAAAQGPWILTADGRYVYDVGGYGMLGLGHNPPELSEALARPQVMANIMTPNPAQGRFWELIREELPYGQIVCLNSGSEANTFAMRLANVHHHPRPVRVALAGSFHGRTEGPAAVSGSSRAVYREHLSDYRSGGPPVYFLEPDDVGGARRTFEEISHRGEHPELTLIEPVQGEGDPGRRVSDEFYRELRQLTARSKGLLMVDSVQSGWRCSGELSVTALGPAHLYPPDIETFSKAIGGGQFPLSVVGLGPAAVRRFRSGLYGNTMTANPRALDVGSAVLRAMTPELRHNVRTSGEKLLRQLEQIAQEFPFVERAAGEGLLLALHLDSSVPVMRLERDLRERGLNVIHGGTNALRLTPWFRLGDEEIALISNILRDALRAEINDPPRGGCACV